MINCNTKGILLIFYIFINNYLYIIHILLVYLYFTKKWNNKKLFTNNQIF